MSRTVTWFCFAIFLASLCSTGCMATGRGLISLNRSGDESPKLASDHSDSSAKTTRALDEIPDDLNIKNEQSSRWPRWMENFRKPQRITLPRTDKETLLTSKDEPDPTSF